MALKKGLLWLIPILILGAIIRLYQLEGYLQFLGDQGRDVLIVKKMIVDHDITLLGPTASVGGFFTGPIYYYLMIPFLWLFNLNPVGPAILSVSIGLGTLVVLYLLCAKFWNPRVGLIAAFIAALNPKMVDISRFSWNPNPVPFFALLSMLLLFELSKNLKWHYSLFLGISLGILYQLHYIDTAFIAIVFLLTLLIIPLKAWPKQAAVATIGSIAAISPFILFEILHNFPNTKSVLEFVSRGGDTVSPRSANFLALIFEILRRLYEMFFKNSGQIYFLALLASILSFAFWFFQNLPNFKDPVVRAKVAIISCWLILGAFALGNYRGDLHEHYFVFLYPLPFILLGLFFDNVFKIKWSKPLFIIGIAVITYVQILNLYFWQPPNNMLSQIKQIDEKILEFAAGKPYNLALVSDYNTDHSYRYFLELWNKSPTPIENPQIDPKRKTVKETLVVICERKNCQLLGNSLWEIAGFGQAQIEASWQGPAGITVYKLIHYRGE